MSAKTTPENESIETTPTVTTTQQIDSLTEREEINSELPIAAVESEITNDSLPDNIKEKPFAQTSVESKQKVDDSNQDISINDLDASKVIGGAPVRQWINSEITPTLLKGMKMISVTQPDQPLKVLGEFLLLENKRLLDKKQAKDTVH